MRFCHREIEYTLPDQWWAEAGMDAFVVCGSAFLSAPSPIPAIEVFALSVNDVEPLRRNGSHGVFNDSAEFGTAHDRVVSILRGIRQGAALPPIEVARLPHSSASRFKLIHGAHRFYCALAAGFSHVPAIEVSDFWGNATNAA